MSEDFEKLVKKLKDQYQNGEVKPPANELAADGVPGNTNPSVPSEYQDKPFTFLSEITKKPVEWLWPGRIPLGELTLVDGDPDTNKSSLTLDLAARLSKGQAMPPENEGEKNGEPAKVLLLVAEDSIEKTLPRRLEAAGADLARVAVLNQAMTLPQDLGILRAAIVQTGAKLVVLDPLVVFLGTCNTRDQSVRQALTPVVRLADQTNTAFLAIRHLVKSGGRHRLYRGSGSIGIIGAARSGFLVANSPDDPNMRVLCHTKCNLGPKSPAFFSSRSLPVTAASGWSGAASANIQPKTCSVPRSPAVGKVRKPRNFSSKCSPMGRFSKRTSSSRLPRPGSRTGQSSERRPTWGSFRSGRGMGERASLFGNFPNPMLPRGHRPPTWFGGLWENWQTP